MDRKRRRQTGSLKKLPHKDGRLWWRLQWRRPGEKNATTKWLGQCSKMSTDAARAERDRILEPINAGLEMRVSSMMTLTEFIDNTYLAVKKLVWRADSTTKTSLGILEKHLKAPLGRELIHLVTRTELQDLLCQKAAEGYSTSVVQHIHSFALEIFNMALADGLIRINPVLLTVIPPCKEPKARPILTPKEIELAERSMDIRERLVFRLDTTEGLRPSEWSGLKVQDAKADRIHIRRRNYRYSLNDPKNKKSSREIPLTSKTAALLKEYRKLLVDDSPTAWLFPSETGKTPMDYRNLFRRDIKPALVRCGLGHINFQAMRRTFSSQQKAAGVDSKTRADLMGHSVNVNENEYTQTPFDVKQRAMKKLEKRLVQ